MKSAILSIGFVASAAAKCLSGKATVNLDKTTGPAEQLAAGFLYGIPNNGTSASNAIPDHFFTDIKFRGTRAGGSQLSDGGWSSGGKPAYDMRFNSTLSTYRSARKYDAHFILIANDLWGADGGQDGALYPGDNGNWTETEAFLDQLILDMRTNDLIEDVTIDIWNEPDYPLFWERSWEQYLDYWNHAYNYLRENIPEVKIGGPAAAYAPNQSREKWHSFCANIAANQTIPDQYSWHHIGDDSNWPDRAADQWRQFRAMYDLPERLISVDEYAWPWRQDPANTAWYISQMERNDIVAMRANWNSREDLHDRMADLLGKTEDGEYYPNGEWWMYKYYAEMEGERAATKVAENLNFDVFATVGEDVVKILAGTRTYENDTTVGDYLLEVSGLDSALGLDPFATVSVQTYRFDFEGAFGEMGPPADLGTEDYNLSDGSLRITYRPASNETAYAFEFSYWNNT